MDESQFKICQLNLTLPYLAQRGEESFSHFYLLVFIVFSQILRFQGDWAVETCATFLPKDWTFYRP